MADREMNYSSPSLKRSLYEVDGMCDSGKRPSEKEGPTSEFSVAKRIRNGPGNQLIGVEYASHLNGGPMQAAPTPITRPLNELEVACHHTLHNEDVESTDSNSHMYDDFAGIHGVAFANDQCIKCDSKQSHHNHHHSHHHHNGEHHHHTSSHSDNHRHRSNSDSQMHTAHGHPNPRHHSHSEGHGSGSNTLSCLPEHLEENQVEDNQAVTPEQSGIEGDQEDSVSEISDLSGLSEEGWRPNAGPMVWVHRQMEAGVDPRTILRQMVPQDTEIPWDLNDFTLWSIIINLLSEPPKRKKLDTVKTLDDVSVSCGIPDFRSKDGIYSRLAVEYPDLPDPQAMFDIQYFRKNQGPFFKFAKEIYPGQFEPSTSHKFIKLLEDHDKLLRNYTQNIDTLEHVAGISKVIQCHGSFATATCMTCKYKVTCDAIKDDIMNHRIPRCLHCTAEEPLGIMKPDIVFFGESLPEEFHQQMEVDKDSCDLLIVIGSSLKVRPVALIPNSLPAHVPQILINREPLRHLNFDVELLGDCDIIIEELCCRLGEDWSSLCARDEPLQQITKDDMATPSLSSRQSPMSTTNLQSEENSRMSFHVTQEETRMSAQEEEPTSISEESVQKGSSECDSSHVVSELHRMDSQGSNLSVMSTTSASLPGAPPSSPQDVTVKVETSENKSNKEMEDISTELEELRACWQPRVVNWGSRLKDGQFLFLPPCRYVFQGAEVYESSESDDDDDSSSSSNSESDKSSAMGDALPPTPARQADEVTSSENQLIDIAFQEADSTCSKGDDDQTEVSTTGNKDVNVESTTITEPDTSTGM